MNTLVCGNVSPPELRRMSRLAGIRELLGVLITNCLKQKPPKQRKIQTGYGKAMKNRLKSLGPENPASIEASRNRGFSIRRIDNSSQFVRSVFVAFVCGAALSGCAANMAATGSDGPDLSVVSQKATRFNVERQLGAPEKLQQQANGDWVAVYDVEPRTKPNLARAAGHGTLDLFTFGLWEVVGGPLEVAHARRVLVTARYDQSGKLLQMTSKPKPIL
ncbi:hypothetical protein [Ruegeria meonggei]|uniref:hypothetical protein n=1 Tax=Ruegeria meonggei TaxID=1446476 RepID=UPI003670B692